MFTPFIVLFYYFHGFYAPFTKLGLLDNVTSKGLLFNKVLKLWW